MKTSNREILTLWRACKLFEFIRQRGDEPDDYLTDITRDSWRKYDPSSVVFGLDRAYYLLQQIPKDSEDWNWETLWRYADLKMRAFDENIATTEPIPADVVAKMFKVERDE